MSTEKILKYLIYLGVTILLFVPFIVTSSMYFPYITGKAYTFRIVTEIIVGLWAILAVLYPIYRPRKNLILYTFGAFLISTFVSNLFGVNQVASFWSNFERMEGWVTFAHLFALLLALGSVLRDKKEWIVLFNTSIVVSLFMVASAFSQVFENGFNTRVDTTLGNSTYLGIYMLIHAFLSLFLLLRQKIDINFYKSWPIYFYGISFILQTIILFQTGTRGSMLGLLGGLVLMGLLMTFLNKENQIFRKIALGTLGFVIIFVATIFLFKDSSFVKDIQPLNRITTISVSEGTEQARILNWQIATEGFKERPILGWGQSNFNYVFDKHYLPEHYGNETWFDRVHNIIFDWLIAGGILGLLFYLSIWFATIWLIFKTKNFSPNEKSVLVALLAGYFFHNLFVFDQIVSYLYFIFILAFVYSQTSFEITAFQKSLEDRLKMLLVSLIIISISATIYFVNYQSYKANRELIDATGLLMKDGDRIVYKFKDGIYGNIAVYEKALSRNTFANDEIRQRIILMFNEIARIENLDEKVQADYLNFALSEIEKQIEIDPINSKYPYLLGSFLAQIGQFELAEQFLLKTIELSPNKQAMRVPLIKVYRISDQKEKALALAKETYELDETKYDLWFEYFNTALQFDRDLSKQFLTSSAETEHIKKIEEVFVSQINADPNNVERRISLAAFYFQIGLKETSIEVLEKAIEDFPEVKANLQKMKEAIEAGEDPIKQKF